MVVTHRETGNQICIGMEVAALPNLRTSLESVEVNNGDFIIGPLVHPRYERGFPTTFPSALENASTPLPPQIKRKDPFTRSDLELQSSEWSSAFIGKLSPWIRCDSESERLRTMSESALLQEVAFANHLSLRAVITPPLTRRRSGANLGRVIYSALSTYTTTQIWVRIPLSLSSPTFVDESGQAITALATKNGEDNAPAEESDSWEIWNELRSLCDGHPNLGVALEITSTMPLSALERWNGEPVRLVLVSTRAFVPNRHGFPVLPRRQQEFIRQMFKYKCYFAVSGRPGKFEGGEGMQPYVQYLGHLFTKQPASSHAEDFEAPYYDYLQSPLQPLSDNLESNTYEVFERDPVKYERYREAVAKYLQSRPVPAEKVIIMVLGAGRGPLVRECLKASEETGVPVYIYAVEKNPNAVVTLQSLVLSESWANVEVVASDMRQWNPEEKADLVVSELLGSFGDNELSPECLDGAQRCLKETGVSIPSSYTSYLAPLSSLKLHNEVRALGETTASMETPYVVKIHRGYLISKPVACFTFTHPDKELVEHSERDNSRYTKLTFSVAESSTLHGFAGYFETVLFDDVKLSIVPETFSTGMFSWFPIYFPIRVPVQLKKGENVEVHVWRRCKPTKVWYEWCISSPQAVPIHNPNGRSYAMSLG